MNREILTKIANYSAKYTLLKVTNGKNEFYISGIKRIGGCRFPDLMFTRLFADNLVMDNPVTDAKINREGNIILKFGSTKYTVTPITAKAEATVNLPNEIHLETLINEAYIDKNNISKTADSVYLPIDAHKIANLTMKQRMRIKLLLEKHLDGAQIKYQCSRVPAFTVKFSPEGYKIYGHIHDIMTNKPLNTIELYDSEDCLSQDSEFKPFVEFAKSYIK